MNDGLAVRSGQNPARGAQHFRQDHGVSERGFGQLGRDMVPKFKAGEKRTEDVLN